ncbi:hypothetical protein ACXX9E_29720 [Pseudomonas sp. GNP014]
MLLIELLEESGLPPKAKKSLNEWNVNRASAVICPRTRVKEIEEDQELLQHIALMTSKPAGLVARTRSRSRTELLLYVRALFDLYQCELVEAQLYVQRVFVMDQAELFWPAVPVLHQGGRFNDLSLNVSWNLQKTDHRPDETVLRVYSHMLQNSANEA